MPKDKELKVSKTIDNKKLSTALKRARGQIDALIRVLESEDYDPEKLMIQFSAVVSALQKGKIRFLEEYTKAKVISALGDITRML